MAVAGDRIPMMASPNARDIEQLRAVVARRLGLHFDDTKLGFLAELLQRRAKGRKQDCSTYVEELAGERSGQDEWAALAGELTVPETHFFRNPDQFMAFTKNALPNRMQARAVTRKISILAAGCASGEEAYSLAIAAREAIPDPGWVISVKAVDLNPAVIEKARRARYSNWALRETSAEDRRRWFTAEGREYILNDAVRNAVDFSVCNLATDDPALWKPGAYDVVFCRNVLMYFTPEGARAVVARIARALAPGGYFFMGHAETLRGVSQDFHLLNTHGAFYYERKKILPEEGADAASPAAPHAEVAPLPAFVSLPALVDTADSWIDAIQRATERIQALSEKPAMVDPKASAPKPPPAPSAQSAQRAWDLGLALEHLEKEQFAEALSLVHALPPEAAGDTGVLLLRAVLLTHSGKLEEAEAACQELLQRDELNSGAHYLLALCREGAADLATARQHNQTAAYLDAGFAMPRLHLGLLARRAGDLGAARAEFGQALTLLQREDVSRLILFGGGFGRDALLALCRAELLACGGQP